MTIETLYQNIENLGYIKYKSGTDYYFSFNDKNINFFVLFSNSPALHLVCKTIEIVDNEITATGLDEITNYEEIYNQLQILMIKYKELKTELRKNIINKDFK